MDDLGGLGFGMVANVGLDDWTMQGSKLCANFPAALLWFFPNEEHPFS